MKRIKNTDRSTYSSTAHDIVNMVNSRDKLDPMTEHIVAATLPQEPEDIDAGFTNEQLAEAEKFLKSHNCDYELQITGITGIVVHRDNMPLEKYEALMLELANKIGAVYGLFGGVPRIKSQTDFEAGQYNSAYIYSGTPDNYQVTRLEGHYDFFEGKFINKK